MIALCAVGAAFVLGSLIAVLVETDEEAIERVTEECREAFLAGDADALIARSTTDATVSGLAGRGPLAESAREWVTRAGRRVAGATLSLRVIEVDGDDGRAEWLATVRMRDSEMVPFARLTVRIDYRRGPEGWRIRHVEILPP